VYPGCTEEDCVPLLEQHSGLSWAEGGKPQSDKGVFHVGYSPERINPGDKTHRLETITKVVSGDSPAVRDRLVALYGEVVTAGIHPAASIKVAEAAKVIENTQRDLNIALMNELSLIFNRLDIDTLDVLEAAGTKWNFLPFRPGLVGGHCIGVDPYYLTHRAEAAGYHPQVILAGRQTNDNMGKFIAEQTVKRMVRSAESIRGARITVLGLTFKENCPDLRNSRVVDIIAELQEYQCQVQVHDPLADPAEAQHEYGLELCAWDELEPADALVLEVPHREFLELPTAQLIAKATPRGCIIDVKSVLERSEFESLTQELWRL
jgi:UDP-N-acetyl-D-galactosamine dehydrogenase